MEVRCCVQRRLIGTSKYNKLIDSVRLGITILFVAPVKQHDDDRLGDDGMIKERHWGILGNVSSPTAVSIAAKVLHQRAPRVAK